MAQGTDNAKLVREQTEAARDGSVAGVDLKVDVVAVPSIAADGTPDQTGDFVQLEHDVRTGEDPGNKKASAVVLKPTGDAHQEAEVAVADARGVNAPGEGTDKAQDGAK